MRTTRIVVAFAAALATAITACGTRPICPVVAPSRTDGQPFLWRAQKPGGETVVWLFGTIHNAGIDAVPRVALDALDRAPRILTELGDEPLDADLFRAYARRRSGPGIDQELPEDDWFDLVNALRGTIEQSKLRRAAPWYAMSLLTKQAAPKGPTMDTQLALRAEDRDTPIGALESWEAQLKALSSVVTLADLQEAIHARATLPCDHARMRASYVTGDADVMTALLVVPRGAETMLFARNRAWMPRIERAFSEGGAFVAVGLGHLLGEQGLPTLLARAGYTVERVGADRSVERIRAP